jgi:hypothetical protein
MYWEDRYNLKGTSGAGSIGRLAKFKANVLNEFVWKNDISSIIEFGFGDGNQLMLADYPNYIGFDVSSSAVNMCRRKFEADRSKFFFNSSDFSSQKAQLTISLDVVYHLIEDKNFHKYMSDLFNVSQKYVIIYSSNYDDPCHWVPHQRHRRFTDWIETNRPDFRLTYKLQNIYPYKKKDQTTTSLADFYFFNKN